MPPGRNTTEAVCGSRGVGDSATILKFLTVLYLTTALPKPDVHTAMGDSRKKMDSGLRALYGCKDSRLARSFFGSSLKELPLFRQPRGQIARALLGITESACALRDWLVSGISPGGQGEDPV